uniref:HAT C-terminal dimerisation domain-containing protein n=1 Tax=Chelonoidis abingdonii TaxID=106734 RepID=A0A8C0G4C2_CHEAB
KRCFLKVTERLNCNKTVDQYHQCIKAKTEHWGNDLHRIMALSWTIAVENLAFLRYRCFRASPTQRLEYICCLNNMASVFPNTFIAQCILLTLHITVASAEHIFSKPELKCVIFHVSNVVSGLETICQKCFTRSTGSK